MAEVRSLHSASVQSSTDPPSTSGLSETSNDLHSNQYGLFATTNYNEGDVILRESPIIVLSHHLSPTSSGAQKAAAAASTASVRDVIKSQFDNSSFSNKDGTKQQIQEDEKSTNKQQDKSSPLTNLSIPKDIIDKIKSTISPQSIEARVKKLKGMILAAATYAAYPPSGVDSKRKLFELHHPPLDTQDEEEAKAVQLAKLAIECCKSLAAPNSSLYNLLHQKANGSDEDELLNLLLLYSCNAFEGGRIYHTLSRVNHSCNPNAVVCVEESTDSSDVSVLKAACPIPKGSEITISYLGKELYAGYPVRQRKLRLEKHFVCRCIRCAGIHNQESSNTNNGEKNSKEITLDLASCIPCPICHPRSSRYLDDDVMFDEIEDDLQISYAYAQNGMSPEERNLHCSTCGGVTSLNVQGSVRKKKEGQVIQYMSMAEDKVYDQMDTNIFNEEEGTSEEEQEVDRSLLQMATATCGSRHWTTHMLQLAIIEETLANLQSTLMTMEPDDEKMMEEVYTDIAECADGIEKAFAFAKSLELNLDPAHWLFDYVLGLSRTLVGLGDEKSQRYGADWIERVEGYADRYESEGMRKVVGAIKNAWKRDKDVGGTEERNGPDAKRRKVE
ncbi:hypothetical protein ACHAWO_007227 [Cyclotella atomus]|uniref:SET domain-containing protein n=1 Tax=Cyclotella atomus TaxID=382360 RepID=A0ABD3NJ45_9STRA